VDVKRICLVIHSLQAGGMERVMSELANYFARDSSNEVYLILYGIKPEVFYTLSQQVFLHTPAFEFDNSRRLWSTLKRLWYLRGLIKRIQPDTILSFGERWNSFALIANLGLNYPLFVSDRCQPDKSLGVFHDRLRKWLYPKATGVICQTAKAKEIFEKAYRHQNFSIIGNPIRKIESNSETQRENIVLSVGRLIDSKHLDLLIQMFAELDVPDWKLVIVGDDALKQQNMQKLKQLVIDLGMEGRIELVGKRTDVDDFYNRAKIFAFTSSSEGFPNVIGEAMAAGLPVVAFDCVAGPSEMIDDGENGFLIPLFDKEMFKSRLNSLMSSEGLMHKYGENAKSKINLFSINSIGKHFHNVINLNL
jgi:glycosyltransferase involved in cell wall biosynthesis